MNEEILSEFFSFVSTDGQVISSKNLSDFEIFIQRPEFEDIHEDLIAFLNDLVYFTVNHMDIKVDEGMINKKGISQTKKNYKDSKAKEGNRKKVISYKKLYQKNTDVKRIKNHEMNYCQRHLLKNKSINLLISAELFVMFFNINQPDYREAITNFVGILGKIIQQKLKSSLHNYNIVRRSSRQYKSESEINHTPLEMTSHEIKTNFPLDKSNENENDNQNKISETCLSDNEIVMKNKMNLFRVLKGVTTKIIKNQKEAGKEVPIIVEANVLPEIETIITQKPENKVGGDDKIISHQEVENNTSHQPLENNNIIHQQEIDLKIVNEEYCNTNHKQEPEKKITNEIQKQMTEDKTKKAPENEKKQRNGKSRREGCRCKCFIF